MARPAAFSSPRRPLLPLSLLLLLLLQLLCLGCPARAAGGCPSMAPASPLEAVASQRLRERAAQGASAGGIRLAQQQQQQHERRQSHGDHPREVEYPTFDGFYNNLGNPSLGGHDTQMMRYLPPAYADGTQSLSNPDGPEPRVVSERTMAGFIGTESQRGRTVMLTHFGQHIVEEIINAMPPQCVTE